MRYLHLDDRVSRIGLGTWQFGSREWGYGDAYAQREAGRILRRALELGVTLVDTAEAYGFGRSERIVGAVLAQAESQALVATKLMPVAPLAPVVRRRARASARRLRVPHLDLYQVHQPNPVVPDTVTMRGMRDLLDGGLVSRVGVSNYRLGRWIAADAALGEPVWSNQVRYSLVDRGPERNQIPWAAEHDRVIIAYSPLAQGLLTGSYDEDHPPSGAVRRASPRFFPENLRRARELVGVLGEVAAAHGATRAQVALAWLLRHPNVVVIPGASGVEQVASNVEAAELELAPDEVRALERASDRYRPETGLAAVTERLRSR